MLIFPSFSASLPGLEPCGCASSYFEMLKSELKIALPIAYARQNGLGISELIIDNSNNF